VCRVRCVCRTTLSVAPSPRLETCICACTFPPDIPVTQESGRAMRHSATVFLGALSRTPRWLPWLLPRPPGVKCRGMRMAACMPSGVDRALPPSRPACVDRAPPPPPPPARAPLPSPRRTGLSERAQPPMAQAAVVGPGTALARHVIGCHLPQGTKGKERVSMTRLAVCAGPYTAVGLGRCRCWTHRRCTHTFRRGCATRAPTTSPRAARGWGRRRRPHMYERTMSKQSGNAWRQHAPTPPTSRPSPSRENK
jgi:hypothetical protein